MSDKNNKVKYNLKNAHYALLTIGEDGAVSVGLALDLRTGSRTVIHHVADMAHIPVKLKKQGKQCQFCVRVFNQNALGIQLLSQHIRSETLRNQCKPQIPFITQTL